MSTQVSKKMWKIVEIKCEFGNDFGKNLLSYRTVIIFLVYINLEKQNFFFLEKKCVAQSLGYFSRMEDVLQSEF
jgi:hypothetical protein